MSTREASDAVALPCASPRRIGRQRTTASDPRIARASFRAAHLPHAKANRRILADSVRFDMACQKPDAQVRLRHRAVRGARSSLGWQAGPLWFRPLCFSENDGSVLLHLAPTPDGAGLTEGRTQDTCGSESWQIHRAVVCLPEPPVPDAGLRDSHKLSVWKRSVSPKTDRPPWRRWRLGPCTPGGCGAGR